MLFCVNMKTKMKNSKKLSFDLLQIVSKKQGTLNLLNRPKMSKTFFKVGMCDFKINFSR